MAKAEWGVKRVCPNCGTRYYDMKKKTPVCPSCGTAYDAEIIMKSRRGRAAAKPAAEVQAPEEVIDALPEAAGEEAEDALIEDAEELADDGETLEVEKEEN